MFLIEVQKLFPLGLICNIIIILFVFSSSADKSDHGSINTPRFANISKIERLNEMKKVFEDNTNNNRATVSSATDSEVSDLLITTDHSKSTSPVAAVTKAPKGNIKSDDTNYFNIDSISEAESKLRTNGRFNPTSGAIAAATCLSLAVVGYLGIVLWRNVVHRSYENREILLNEDDIGDINDEDMRHFEAACIEIET